MAARHRKLKDYFEYYGDFSVLLTHRVDKNKLPPGASLRGMTIHFRRTTYGYGAFYINCSRALRIRLICFRLEKKFFACIKTRVRFWF